MSLRLVIASIAIALILGLAGGCWLLSGKLHDARAQRDTAIAQRDQAYRAIDELAVERAAADRRAEILQTSREAIITAPAADDGDVAPVLWQGLRAADEIGGIE